MKNVQFLLLALSVCVLGTACHKDDDDSQVNHSEDVFVFGHFYGECMGEYCVEIFRIAGDKVYEDANDKYPGNSDFYDGDFSVELSTEDWEAVEDLVDDFPDGLWSEAETIIGMPDAGDWGGIYVEYKKGDEHDFWLLDQMKDNVPEAYHEFIDSVNAKIALLQP